MGSAGKNNRQKFEHSLAMCTQAVAEEGHNFWGGSV